MANQEKLQDQDAKKISRRNVLKAAVAAGGVAALGFPMIARGQTGPITMRWQSTWPQKDIFHEFAL
ncbi:MAG: C4-dicarboxylate transporter, partial [Deltaproteobacteria bacterium]|nr:C4-dicarboxylate transporter [Deltaproteobacteria bacterium]